MRAAGVCVCSVVTCASLKKKLSSLTGLSGREGQAVHLPWVLCSGTTLGHSSVPTDKLSTGLLS